MSLKNYPRDASILLTVHSLKKRQEELETQLLRTADEIGSDVCSYRLLSDGTYRPSVSAFAKALADFQNLFSVVYDAIKNGPKERARLSSETEQETAFTFGYTFSGSIGAVFTLPNERLLPGIWTDVDATMEAIGRVAKAETIDQIASFAKAVGRAPIRAAYTWARDHAHYGLGASIGWHRGAEVSKTVTVQRPELERLERTIVLSSEETTEEFNVRGMLEAADVRRHNFRIAVEGGEDIRGWFRDAIDERHVVTIPQRYDAIVQKKTRIVYSTEQEEVSYFLVSLKKLT